MPTNNPHYNHAFVAVIINVSPFEDWLPSPYSETSRFILSLFFELKARDDLVIHKNKLDAKHIIACLPASGAGLEVQKTYLWSTLGKSNAKVRGMVKTSLKEEDEGLADHCEFYEKCENQAQSIIDNLPPKVEKKANAVEKAIAKETRRSYLMSTLADSIAVVREMVGKSLKKVDALLATHYHSLCKANPYERKS